MRPDIALAALTASLLTAPAYANELFKPYDKFDGASLDPERWTDGERVRTIKGGALQLMQRYWGFAGADVGVTSSNWSSNLPNGSAITQMRARVTVNSIQSDPCATNPIPGDARARLIGGFFNTGVATPGSQVGDVTAQVRFIRASNSVDAPGVTRVQGIVLLCSTADCAAGFTVGNVIDLGTALPGATATVQFVWNQANKMFEFSRDAGAYAGNVAYAFDDSNPPGVPFRQLSTRVNVPNCTSSGRVGATIDARFDQVFLNESAVP
jgi:hypothetical protein